MNRLGPRRRLRRRPPPMSQVYSDLCRMCIATGKSLTELDREDFLTARAHMIGSGRASRTLTQLGAR